MLRIITLNLNGIRSATKKGALEWISAQKPDFVCLQEIKAQEKDLDPSLKSPAGMNAAWSFAEKPGYSGVGLLKWRSPEKIASGLGVPEFDREGRWVCADFPENLTIASLYLPSGSSSEERQAAKFRFMDAFLPHMKQLRDSGREVVICGDHDGLVKAVAQKKAADRRKVGLPKWLSAVLH